MQISQNGLKFTEHWEGDSLVAYRDSGGIWTIGVGHTGPEVHEGLIWTQQQEDDALREDMLHAQDCVNVLLGNSVVVTQEQFDALCDFEFNTGALASSTLLKCLKAGDFAGAQAQFDLWDHVKGKVIQGLLNRREAETQLFAGPDAA
jgi:lysozyme